MKFFIIPMRPGNRSTSVDRRNMRRNKLRPGLKSNPDVKNLAAACDTGDITIAHLINRRLEHSAQSEDCEFSRATVNELRSEGLADVRQAIADVEWLEPRQLGHGIRVYDLTR